jgi:hypothetical protein
MSSSGVLLNHPGEIVLSAVQAGINPASQPPSFQASQPSSLLPKPQAADFFEMNYFGFILTGIFPNAIRYFTNFSFR